MKLLTAPRRVLSLARARRAAIDRELAVITSRRERIGRELIAMDDRRSALLAERRRLGTGGDSR